MGQNGHMEPEIPGEIGPGTASTHASDGAPQVNEQPLSFPIWQVADYAYDSAEHYADVINERRDGQIYGRYGGPTVERLASVLAALEGAEAGWAFSSGMGAIHAVLMAVAGQGDRIVAARTLYGGTYGLFTEGCERVGIEVTFADCTDVEKVAASIEGAKAVFVETIANPTFEIADIEGIGRVARDAGVPLIVDNTVATPALFRPIGHGANLVVHSTSKYVGGHHDLMGGAVLGPADLIDAIKHLAVRYGTTASAFESWLALRGVATLALRMSKHSENAMMVAELLESSEEVTRVIYPGLPTHPQHDRALKLLSGFGGMVAANFGSQAKAWRFMDSCRIARVGSSFGGVRTELTHPATTSHRQFSERDRDAAGITDGLVRISVGIEDAIDLTRDFEAALEKLAEDGS